MDEEASIAIVARMHDEASPGLQQLARNTEQVQLKSISTTVALSALGSALSSVGGLLRQIDTPGAKMLSTTLQIASSVVLTATAFSRLIPILIQATSAMRSMAIVQSVLTALSGPGGWAMLGIGAAVGVGATAGIMRATRSPQTAPQAGMLEGRSVQSMIIPPSSGQTVITQHYHIAGSVITERELSETVRRQFVNTQQRNAGKSGIT